jgi:hypothetical protein
MPEKENFPNVEKDGWKISDIAEQATNESPDEILRKTLRESDSKNTADKQDIVGSIDSSETPHGREENKKVEGAKKLYD